jgi:hypothetical protein
MCLVAADFKNGTGGTGPEPDPPRRVCARGLTERGLARLQRRGRRARRVRGACARGRWPGKTGVPCFHAMAKSKRRTTSPERNRVICGRFPGRHDPVQPALGTKLLGCMGGRTTMSLTGSVGARRLGEEQRGVSTVLSASWTNSTISVPTGGASRRHTPD